LGFLTGAPATNFARKRVKPRCLTFFCASTSCVVICRASSLYEMRSGRSRFCRRFRVFCLLSVKVCSWYKTHSKTRNLAGVRYVCILPVPGIQFRPVTVSFEAFSGHKTMMYTLKVGFTILINLIGDRGFDCNCIINGRVELLVEYTPRRLRSCDLTMAPGLGVGEMSGMPIQSTTSHDHTGRFLPCTQFELRIKLENDACRPPFYSQNKRTQPAPNLNPFSKCVSRTHIVTLAHTYILTRTPHMCTRTDYHSVYTHPCKLRVHIRKYTHQHMQLCVPIYIYEHKHLQTLCVCT